MRQTPSRVLLVDDEPRNLLLLEAILEPLAVRTCTATNGREALAVFQQSSDELDLVLLDVMMPELDGFRALTEMRRLQAVEQRVPVVLVSALGGREDRMRALECGADDFLAKPLDPHEVRCRVRTFLALQNAQRSLRRIEQGRSAVVRGLGRVRSSLAALEDAHGSTVGGALRMLEVLADLERLGAQQLTRHPVRLRDLLQTIASRYQQQAPVEVDVDPHLTASVDAGVFERAIAYFVEHLSPRRGSSPRVIQLAAARHEDAIMLSVARENACLEDQEFGAYLSRVAAESHGGSGSVRTDALGTTSIVMTVADERARRASAFID